jgi:hypothetical protein
MFAVKRRSRINFSFEPERIERLKATPEFQEIATSDKPPGNERDDEIRFGKSIQGDIILLLRDMDKRRVYHDREEFLRLLESVFKGFIRFPDDFWGVMIEALSEQEK